MLSSGATGAMLLASWPELAQAAAYAERTAQSGRGSALKNFDAASTKDIEAATAQIFPSDGTPGAREAGVVFFLDKAVGGMAPELKAPLTGLVATLNGEAGKRFPGKGRYAALSEPQQHELMVWLEKENGQLFGMLRSVTITAMFANPSYGGNKNKVGWKLLGFRDQFSWSAPFGYYDRG